MWNLKKKNIFKSRPKPVNDLTILILDELVKQKKRIQILENNLFHTRPEDNPYSEESEIISMYQQSLPRPPPRNSSMRPGVIEERKQMEKKSMTMIPEEEVRNSWLEDLYSVRKSSFRNLLSPKKMTKFPSFPNSEFV